MPAELFHQAIVQTHQLCVVIILEHKLSRADFCFLAQKYFRPEVALKLVQRGADVRIRMNFYRRVTAT